MADLHGKIKKARAFYSNESLDTKVAEALADAYPDKAIAIWKTLAERHIALVKPAAYADAAHYLKNIYRLKYRNGKTGEWNRYLLALRKEHARKIRLMQELDKVERIKLTKGKNE